MTTTAPPMSSSTTEYTSTTEAPTTTCEPTKQVNQTPVGCLPETDTGPDEKVSPPSEDTSGRVRSDSKSEESIKIRKQVESGEITRDTAESLKDSVRMQKRAYGAVDNPICTTGEEDTCVQKPEWASCPGTPGDTTYNWLEFERPESPGTDLPLNPQEIEEDIENLTPTQLEERLCKRRFTRKTYIKMWGSEEAVRRWNRQWLEARRKRNQLEKMHAQNAWLREKMRNHARLKRRMYRCKDQSKIPSQNEDVQINKAFYFRFSYNNQVPCMPSDMDKHFSKFNKPPFKNGGLVGCVKAVDEFEKLRVQKKEPA